MNPKFYICVLALLLVNGCAVEDLFTEQTEYSKKLQVANGLVMLNKTDHEIEILNVSRSSIHKQSLYIPKSGELVHRFFRGPKGKESTQLYITTYPENERETEVVPALNIVSSVDGTTTLYEIGSLFGKTKFGPDNQFIILYHDSNDGSITNGLFNPNEIAIIDQTKPLSPFNPRIISINISGHTIEDIVFLDEVQVGAISRKLVAFVTKGVVQFTDFNDPNFATINVALKNDTDNRTIIPRKFTLMPQSANSGPRLFVLASGATEIFDIEFNPKDNEVGFYATTSLLDGGASPSDFALIQDGTDLFLISVSSAYAQMSIFDVSTASVTTLALQDRLDTIMERNHNGTTELVIHGPNTNNIYLLPSTDIAKEKGNNLEIFHIPAGISQVQTLDSNRLFIRPFDSNRIVLADLRNRTLTPLSTSNTNDFLDDGILWNETFFLNQIDRISFLNISTGSPSKLTLDEPSQNFYVFDTQGVGLVMHSVPTGRATIFPLSNPTRAAASIIDGFFVDEFINGEEE